MSVKLTVNRSTFDSETIPVALIEYDRSGRVTESNEAARALLGAEARVGARIQDSEWLVTDAAGWPLAENLHPVLAVIASGEAYRDVIAKLTTRSGSELWLRIDAIPVRSAAATVENVVLAVVDVTRFLNDIRLPRPSYGAAAVAAITDAIAKADLNPKSILEAAVAALSKVRAGTWVASLLEKDPRTMSVRAANDTDPEIARYIEDMQLRADAPQFTVAAHVIESGEPVLMPEIPFSDFMGMLNSDIREYVDKHPPPTSTAHLGVLVVPMRARSSVVGTLGLYERRSSNPLTKRDVRWVQEIADRVGLAADNAQLYVDAVSRLDRLTGLRSVQLAISQSPDLRLILAVILDQALQGLSVDAADVLLVDESGQQLELVTSTGFRSTSIPDYKLPVDEGIPARAITGRRIETLTGLGAFAQFRRRTLFAREGFKTYGAVPLMVGGRLVGVLEVFHRSSLKPDREWFEFFDALGSEAALAIERFALQQAPPPAAARGAISPSPAVTEIQKRILAFVVEGLSNAAIAEKVHLSTHAIKFHVGQMLDRAGVHNRTELAHRATQERWL